MSAAALLADRIRRIRPSRLDPSHVIAELQDLALEVERLPVPTSPTAMRIETADPRADERVKRLAALLRQREQEIDRLQRLVAAAARPAPRRSHHHDHRQDVML